MLQYWEQDPATQVVALYLESFGNPRKFGRVARRVARAKPVLAVKAGRTSAGARAASSHTGALIAASDSTVDALFASAGVIRCDGLDDLLDAAAVLAEQPPRGSSGSSANARGPLVVCADACADAGLGVASPVAARPRPRCARRCRQSVVAGPVQLVAAETPAGFAPRRRRVAADAAVDAPAGGGVGIVANARGPLVVCADACADAGWTSPPLGRDPGRAARGAPVRVRARRPGPARRGGDARRVRRRGRTRRRRPGRERGDRDLRRAHRERGDEVAAALAAAAPALHAAGTPLAAVFMTPGPLPAVLREGCSGKVPTFRAPEAAARALGPCRRLRALPRVTGARAAAAGRRRQRRGRGRARGSLARGGGWLRPDEVAALLSAYGIALVEQRRVSSAAAAAKAAAELGGPVALKGVAPGVVHKARAGAVRLDLHGPTAVRRAAQEIAQRLEAAGTPVEDFLVQRMAGAGVEMLVGVLADERFGPVVACGAGGGTAEVLEDVAGPARAARARGCGRMIAGLRSRALLERARADVDALADIAVRVGALADAHPGDRGAGPQPGDGRARGCGGGRRPRPRGAARRPAGVPGRGRCVRSFPTGNFRTHPRVAR